MHCPNVAIVPLFFTSHCHHCQSIDKWENITFTDNNTFDCLSLAFVKVYLPVNIDKTYKYTSSFWSLMHRYFYTSLIHHGVFITIYSNWKIDTRLWKENEANDLTIKTKVLWQLYTRFMFLYPGVQSRNNIPNVGFF
jgi:hypothetical protein